MNRNTQPLACLVALLLVGACGDDGSGDTGSMNTTMATSTTDASESSAEGPADSTSGGGLAFCPDDGRATLRLSVLAEGQQPVEADRLTYALFESWPPMAAPARSELLPGSEVAFPYELVDTAVKAGEYALYVCFDPDGDTPVEAVCDDDELWLLYDGGNLLSIEAGQVVDVTIDLVAGTGTLDGSQAAADLGCS
ncbi:MAG: hypothetical protein KDK70_12435 [Myxococcales bacterium]|nr:hypothetical protein [Myxococcales bacterium]